MAVADKIKEILKSLQDKGIPIAVFQDPITKLPSITFSFFLVSGVVCLLASFDNVKALAGINYNEVKDFFDMTMFAYLGRSAIKASLGVPGVNKEEKKENE
jgi:hypothetical protein